MKKYKLVYLNKGLHLYREKDLEQTENNINQYIKDGWQLQQIVSPNDVGGALYGVFYKENEDD